MDGLVVPKGRPRYVNGIFPTWHPKVLAKCDALLGVRLIGTRKDFPKLIWSPLESEKVLRSPLRLKSVGASPGRINRVSSAYWTIG